MKFPAPVIRSKSLLQAYSINCIKNDSGATSLDLWSDFLRSNADYSEIMRRVAEDKPTERIGPPTLDVHTNPPPRARVFVLPATLFVADVISDPVAARYLATYHLQHWDTDPRLLLCDSINSVRARTTCQIEDHIRKIPDFMLIDDSYVYGRMDRAVISEVIPNHQTVLGWG